MNGSESSMFIISWALKDDWEGERDRGGKLGGIQTTSNWVLFWGGC